MKVLGVKGMRWWMVMLLFLGVIVAEGVPMFPGEEKYLKNFQQLTIEGINAEAYFSFDGQYLIFQSTREDSGGCDQIYTLNLRTGEIQKISHGGRTTCAYFFPDGEAILYSSTIHLGEVCPEIPPAPSRRYAWPLLNYDIYIARPDGSELKKLVENPGYDAEATISKEGEIVFTSLRDADLGIYLMDKNGRIRKLINEPGYEGGAFFSPDGKKIVFRAFYPKNPEQKKEYFELLQQGFIAPPFMEIFTIGSDGKGLKQVTKNGALNIAPFYHPDGKHIIFSSNLHNPKGRNFNLYLIREDGSGLRRITFNPGVELFPMFSPDGKKLVFISNRVGGGRKDLHIFLADWLWKGSSLLP